MRSLAIACCMAVTIAFTGCKEMGSNDANNYKMEDTIRATYPSVEYIAVEVKEHMDVTVTLGDKTLFNKSAEEQQAIANTIAGMTVNIYEANNYLRKGVLKFVAVEDRIPNETDEIKEYVMPLEQLLQEKGE
ncbi:MAG: hypothetical protein R2800_02060 [Flavipsychrobacter sp.]